jgi:nicotinate-nucleotide adenylyltransferase
MERLGIFGGTFDPPHWAHLVLAETAREQLALERVLWVLTPDPPHKDRPGISSYPARKRMLLAAIAGNAAFEPCEIELERPGPHFMVETAEILQQRNPDAEYCLLLGEDSLRDLPLWHNPQRLLELCPMAILRRPGCDADLTRLEQTLPGIHARTIFLNAPRLEISSTAIRQRVHADRSIRYLVPDAVEREIADSALYR